MRTAAIPVLFAPSSAGWLAWLRGELAPFPGRLATTIRLMVTVVLVTIVSMTLEVPEVALSAYLVLFVTKENRALTTLVGGLTILGVTLAIALSLFLYRYTLDFPALRVIATAGIIFMGMYLSRVFVLGPLGFAVGFVAAMAQNIVDQAPGPELTVRGLLWLWVAVVYPIALTVVVNQFLLPAHPQTALLGMLTRRFEAATSVLRRLAETGVAGGNGRGEILDLATRGSAPLLKLLALAERRDVLFQERHAAHVAIIDASERLAVAAAALETRDEAPVADGDRDGAMALIEQIADLPGAIRDHRPLRPSPHPRAPAASLPELRELWHTVAELRGSLEKGKDFKPPLAATPTKVKKGLFIADAFTNPAHVHFALKVTLAAMACYLLYTASIGRASTPRLLPAALSPWKIPAPACAKPGCASAAVSSAE